jgi:EAL domain-containing protein (putative c-di-GMP-specific phosphodiesterase class I)
MSVRRVLIVDDDPDLRDELATLAVRAGFDCHCVDGIEAARARLPKIQVELAVVDLSLSEGDGIEGIEILQLIAQQSSRPPILLIGEPDPRLEKSAIAIGEDLGLQMLGVLHKPIVAGQFLAVMRTHPHDANTLRVDELSRALKNEQFFLQYQPKIELESLEISGMEALIRWDSPERGLVFPDEFIELAEKSSLMQRLTLYVLEHALRDCGRWRGAGLTASVAVNVTAHSIEDGQFPAQVETLLREHDLPADSLTLEITETMHRRDARAMLDVLARLRMHGVHISVDDFGTGYSSLTELHDLPLTEVKIDRSFVMNSLHDRDARAIVGGIVGLGHSFGLRVVAEGVETLEHWELMKEMGCDQAQGYHIAKAMSFPDALRWMQQWTRQQDGALGVPSVDPDETESVQN